MDSSVPHSDRPTIPPSPWLTVGEAAAYARCSSKVIYGEVARGRLRAAVVGGRRSLRLRSEWVDAWLTATSTPLELPRSGAAE